MTKPRDIVYTPNEAATLAVNAIQERRQHPGAGVRLGIPCIDKDMLPLRPGDLVTILGRPSDYKSGLMQFWARNLAHEIIDEDAKQDIVVFVTWEMAVEELCLYDLAAVTRLNAADLSQGRIDDSAWERLQAAAMKRAVTPMWFVGHSIERRKRRPRLTMTNIAKALLWVENEMGFHPRIVFLDYLQQMEAEGGETRRMQIFENVHRSKDMALALGCPVVLGCQTHRRVDERKWKLAMMGDGLESSNIEHTADKMLSVWMPKRTEQLGDYVEDTDLKVTDRLLLMSMPKQRMGPAGMWWSLYVDAERNFISELAREQEAKKSP